MEHTYTDNTTTEEHTHMRTKTWIYAIAIVTITTLAQQSPGSPAPVTISQPTNTPVPVYQTEPAYDPILDAWSVVQGYGDTFCLWGFTWSVSWVFRYTMRVLS